MTSTCCMNTICTFIDFVSGIRNTNRTKFKLNTSISTTRGVRNSSTMDESSAFVFSSEKRNQNPSATYRLSVQIAVFVIHNSILKSNEAFNGYYQWTTGIHKRWVLKSTKRADTKNKQDNS